MHIRCIALVHFPLLQKPLRVLCLGYVTVCSILLEGRKAEWREPVACEYTEYDAPNISAVMVLGTEKMPGGSGVLLTAAILTTLSSSLGTGSPSSR